MKPLLGRRKDERLFWAGDPTLPEPPYLLVGLAGGIMLAAGARDDPHDTSFRGPVQLTGLALMGVGGAGVLGGAALGWSGSTSGRGAEGGCWKPGSTVT